MIVTRNNQEYLMVDGKKEIMVKSIKYDIIPCAKPRMTQKDKWDKRPATEKYWFFKAEVKKLKLHLPEEGAHITFMMPMPKSWSKKKQLKMVDTYHKQKPDLDNLIKGLGDAVYQDDSCISDISANKIWSEEGGIIILENAHGNIEKAILDQVDCTQMIGNTYGEAMQEQKELKHEITKILQHLIAAWDKA